MMEIDKISIYLKTDFLFIPFLAGSILSTFSDLYYNYILSVWKFCIIIGLKMIQLILSNSLPVKQLLMSILLFYLRLLTKCLCEYINKAVKVMDYYGLPLIVHLHLCIDIFIQILKQFSRIMNFLKFKP